MNNWKSLIPIHLRSRIADLRGRGIYSLYANQHKCIFIHIPKAAGTSVSQTLFEQGSRHLPWFEYYNANPAKFRQYFKFTFVRNPWDRLVSTWFFLKRGGMNLQDKKWAEHNLANYPDFGSFFKGWMNESSIRSWTHFQHQHYFICDNAGKVRVDFIGRMENLDQDFALVAAKLGCTKTLTKVNSGNHRHYSTYYTDETRAIVARLYATDIELFDYQFHQHDPDTPTE